MGMLSESLGAFVSRRLYLLVEVDTDEAGAIADNARWIWDAHRNPSGVNGVRVGMIAEADMMAVVDRDSFNTEDE